MVTREERTYLPDDEYPKRIPIPEDVTLRRIELAYGYSLGRAEMALLRADGKRRLIEVQLGETTFQSMAQCLRQECTPADYEPDMPDSQFNRSRINSKLTALEVEHKGEVIAFRKEVLGGKLVPLSRNMAGETRIGAWIRKTAKKDGDATLFMNGVAIPNDAKARVVDGKGWLEFHSSGHPLLDHTHESTFHNITGLELAYWESDTNVFKSVYVTEGGVLDRLRRISTLISLGIGWREWEATTFVLTGAYPITRAIEVGLDIHNLNPIGNKITLKIDPTSSFKEVLKAYEKAKTSLFEFPKDKTPRAKRENLALIYRERTLKGLTSTAALAIWNERCNNDEGYSPEWIYRPKNYLSNFTRDSKDAYEKYVSNRQVKRTLMADTTTWIERQEQTQ